MSPQQKDLFEDGTMSFGEHLEELRIHLIRALIGVVLGVIVALIFGQSIVAFVRAPIDAALLRHGFSDYVIEDISSKGFFELFGDYYTSAQKEGDAETSNTSSEAKTTDASEPDLKTSPKTNSQDGDVLVVEANNSGEKERPASLEGKQVEVQLNAYELVSALNEADAENFPEPRDELKSKPITISIAAPEFEIFRETVKKSARPVTFNVQEAFMTFLKVASVAGLLFSSPWVFYQIWMFVAVGLYAHERKFVYFYGTMSLVLFLLGASFCFFVVFRFVLDFLLSFNSWLDVNPQIRLSEWITFAIILPLMFGISFQLPLVMVFIERIGIVEQQDFRDQRRMAILVIAIVSMFLTPADPTSMILMMAPLVVLYELGIVLCKLTPTQSPFDELPTEA